MRAVWCVLCASWCLVCWCVWMVCVGAWLVSGWCCVVLCCVVLCGVGAGVGVQCVVCGVCAVCGAAWHAEKPSVCRFKTSPCVPAPRAHVLFNMHAFCTYPRRPFEPTHTRGRFEPTHGKPLSPLFSLSLVLFSFSLSSVSSFVLFSFSFSALFSSLSATMTTITRTVSSLSVNTALTCPSVRVRGPWPTHCWPCWEVGFVRRPISLLAEYAVFPLTLK